MRKLTLALCAAGLAMGCGTADTPTSRSIQPGAATFSKSVAMAVTAGATVDLTSADAGYMSLNAEAHQRSDGSADGSFTQSRDAGDGTGTADFTGSVTCLSFDPVNHHAWIAGVITENRSTSPAFRDGAIFQPGQDIWFRVVDYGEGSKAPADRSTVFGFKGSAGVQTSAEYCALQLWPNTPVPDARTYPVSGGNIQVHDK